MSKSCHHDFLCSCLNASETIDYVKNKIEIGIHNYMNYEEIVTVLQENFKISDDFINPVWEKLHRDNPDFYKHYHLRCELLRQKRIFNELLVKLAQQLSSSLEIPITTPNGAPDFYQFEDQAIAPAATAPQSSYVSEYSGHYDSTLPFQDSDFLDLLEESYEPHIDIQKMLAPKEPETIMEQCGRSSNGVQHGEISVQDFDFNLDTSQLTQPSMEQCGGSSNGVQHGESSDQDFGFNFDTSQLTQTSMVQYGERSGHDFGFNFGTSQLNKMYTSFDQQQVEEGMLQPQQNHHHHYYVEETIQLHGGHRKPKSEDLNNPDSGDGRKTMAETSMISKSSRKDKVSEKR